MSTTELKRLQTRLAELRDELVVAEREKAAASQKIGKLHGQIRGVEKEIEGMTNREIVVSEHAILRYLERIGGVNIDEVREKILSPSVRKYIDELGSGKFPQNGSETGKYRVVVKNRVVTTVED
jgi:ribosomal protein L16/L10AE